MRNTWAVSIYSEKNSAISNRISSSPSHTLPKAEWRAQRLSAERCAAAGRRTAENRGLEARPPTSGCTKWYRCALLAGNGRTGGIAQNLSGIAYHRGNITAPPSYRHNTKQDFAKFMFYEVLLFFSKKRRRTVFTIRRLFMDMNRYPAVKPIERNVLTPQTLR